MRGWMRRAGGMLAAAGALALSLAGCGAAPSAGSTGGSAAGSAAAGGEATEVRVASLKGPTSIGLVDLMEDAEAGETRDDYTFTISATADEILPAVIRGEVDIALIPANAASVLYNKTEGGVTALDVNTLGVLSVVTGDAAVQEFADLAGRTVYLTGKGTTPEYTMSYLLECAGIADQVTLEFKSEAAEVVAALSADPAAVGVLPQPYTTAALAKNEALSVPINLTDVWEAYAGDTGSQLLTGVTVVRTEFLNEHPEAVERFVEAQAASVAAVNADPAAAAKLVVKAGIIDSEAVAERAIPACNLVCLTGVEMGDALSGYLKVLYDRDPASVGGALPEDAFYYGA